MTGKARGKAASLLPLPGTAARVCALRGAGRSADCRERVRGAAGVRRPPAGRVLALSPGPPREQGRVASGALCRYQGGRRHNALRRVGWLWPGWRVQGGVRDAWPTALAAPGPGNAPGASWHSPRRLRQGSFQAGRRLLVAEPSGRARLWGPSSLLV